jgi:chromate reductase
MSPKILAFAGSLRKDSFNKQLVKEALKGAELAGAQVTYIDLANYPLPLYNADEEAVNFPENAKELKKLFNDHQGFLIATPEYNSSIPAVLKNVIDWVSRPLPAEGFLANFQGKTVAILGASVGALGGRRAVEHLRSIFLNINCTVIPTSYFAAFAGQGLGKKEDIQIVGKALAMQLNRHAI